MSGKSDDEAVFVDPDDMKFYSRDEFATFTTSELLEMRKSITSVLTTRLPECKQLIAELEPKQTRAPRGTSTSRSTWRSRPGSSR